MVRETMRRMPDYQLLYFGDTARTPYGNKGAETIKQYAVEDAEFLLSRGAKIIVIACNTVSAVAYEHLREKFPGVPIFEVVTPAAEAAVAATRNGRIGVIGTRATISSGVYDKKIQEFPISNFQFPNKSKIQNPKSKIQIYSVACPLFVPLVEEGWLNAKETKQIVRKYLYPLKQEQIDTLILGCTHYPLIKNAIRGKIGRKVIVVDSAEEVVGKIFSYLRSNPEIDKSLSRGNNHQFFVSDLTPATESTVKKWLGKNVKLNLCQ